MDHMIIKNLELFGFHGVNSEEKAMGQKFVVDIELGLDLRTPGKSDHIDDTINYAELCHAVELEFRREKYNLIERAAEALCEFILLQYDKICEITLTLKKPWAPIHMPVEYPAIKLSRKWHKAYLGIGTNMGDKEANLEMACSLIEEQPKIKISKQSKWITTKPVGYTEQDDFLNGALEIWTLLSPVELINQLLSIEQVMKRERLIKWGPRVIDLDVLLYDEMITSREDIVIPHPRMHERAFVLEPLNEIAPYHIHPLLNQRIYQIYQGLLSGEQH